MANANLSNAKRAKNDEFYTQLSDIENELKHYKNHFAGKVVYCNCDDARESNFFRFFQKKFNDYGLQTLLSNKHISIKQRNIPDKMGRNIITMEQIVFATHNKNKLEEIRSIINNYEILSLSDIGCNEEIIEDADNIKGNAKIKADFVTNNFHLNCFADDTGLEVEALNGEPGVFSARYAGENCSSSTMGLKLSSEVIEITPDEYVSVRLSFFCLLSEQAVARQAASVNPTKM